MITVQLCADSRNQEGERLTTLICTYPRYIHAEVMTHRVFSRNASSSRAIPVERMIKEAEENPVTPIFVENQKGMQADNRLLGKDLKIAETEWSIAREQAIEAAEFMICIGVHKQIANRLLEPFIHITTLISSTEWDNFFSLRITPHAQQEICELARKMKEVRDFSIPNTLEDGQYHLPFMTPRDIEFNVETRKKLSVARCARVSYLNHDKSFPVINNDIALHDRLKESRHSSPFEHIASPNIGSWDANFFGWKQYRSELSV